MLDHASQVWVQDVRARIARIQNTSQVTPADSLFIDRCIGQLISKAMETNIRLAKKTQKAENEEEERSTRTRAGRVAEQLQRKVDEISDAFAIARDFASCMATNSISIEELSTDDFKGSEQYKFVP